MRFSRPPHLPHFPPHSPALSSRLYSEISHPAPIFPHKRPACFPPEHTFLSSHFPTQKARRHHASGLTFPTFAPLWGLHFSLPGRPLQLKILLRKLGGPQGRGHPGLPPANSAFPISTPSAALPSEPAPFPPAPFSSSHFPPQKARRHPCLRANISHICPSLGTPFSRCRAAPYSLKSSSVNWEVRRGGATRGSRIRGSYW